LRKNLAERVAVTENGRRKRIAKGELMVKQIVNKAAAGDLPAVKQIVQILWRFVGTSVLPPFPPEVGEEVNRSEDFDPEYLKTLNAEELSRLYSERIAAGEERTKTKTTRS
jgi:uncharacterized protein DUF5681